MNYWCIITGGPSALAEGPHPDDKSKIDDFFLFGRVFLIENESGKYAGLRWNDLTFRFDKKFIRPVTSPQFPYDSKVKIESGGKSLHGNVFDIKWHFKDKKHLYFIVVEGRNLNKYFAEEKLNADG